MKNNNIKIISLNVRGISNFKKRSSIFNWCRNSQADLILLQETHSTVPIENLWSFEWGGKILFSHGTNNSRGVAILFKNGSNFDVSNVYHDNYGRILSVNFVKDEVNFTLVNVYAPNIESLQIDFYDDLCNLVGGDALNVNDRIVIGGDFNCILDAKLDKKGGLDKIKQNVVDRIMNIADTFDLVDIWRYNNPNTCKFTWRQPNPLVQCRLDYFLISNSLIENIDNADIFPGLRTDHSAISLDVDIQKDPPRGPGLWKFNNSYLDEDDYINMMNDNLTGWLCDNSISDVRIKWEWIKYKVRDETVRYARKKCRMRKNNIAKLTKQLNSLEESLAKNPSQQILSDIDLVKTELEVLDAKIVDGIIVRARTRWAEKGEKSNKYFLGLEKRNGTKKQCKKLILDNNTVLINSRDILNAQMDYYKCLYESKVDSSISQNNEFLRSNSIHTLDDTDMNICEGKLLITECFDALSKMSKNKSPGNDGLSSEWYLLFWPKIGSFLVNVLNEGLDKGELSSSQRQSVITLIEKGGKDRCKLQNWRPISLLNVDYKIASKTLTMRVEKVIHKLINVDQSGFVKGRFIGDSVRTIQDLMDYTRYNNISGILLFLDFEKAFDSLEHDFILMSLKRMNFGSSFIGAVKALYSNVSSCILNSGLTSPYFNVNRGVRQGDPLSSYLFILAIELLSCSIRDNKNISGIHVNKAEIKLVQYADDTTCVLKDEKSASYLFNVLNNFSSVSGLKLNVSKSQALWLGSKRLCRDKPINLSWPTNPIKALGVYFSYDTVQAQNMNFNPKINEIKTLLNIWRMRNLTLAGKIILIKTFALSKFTYLASVIHIPDNIIQQIDKIIFSFLWNKGNGFVKKSSIIGDIDEGGLRMVNVKSFFAAQKIKWISKYITTESAPWKTLLNHFISPYGGELLFHCNIDFKLFKDKCNLPVFYKDVIILYVNFVNANNVSPLQQCIWNNRHIRVNHHPCYIHSFVNCNIIIVSDLFHNDGTIIPFDVLVNRGLEKKNFMKWRSVMSAIPNAWKNTIKKGFNRGPHCFLNKFVVNDENMNTVKNMKSRCIYDILTKRIFTQPSSQSKYSKEFHIENNEWSNIYTRPFNVCSEVKLRIFQYKFNVNCIMTNKKLCKMKIINNDKCSFCNVFTEDMKHLFWECKCVQDFWNTFNNWIQTHLKLNINLNYKLILFGDGTDLLFNLCIILMKRIIYTSKFKNQPPSFKYFEYLIRFHYNLEKTTMKNSKFCDKWKKLESFCT